MAISKGGGQLRHSLPLIFHHLCMQRTISVQVESPSLLAPPCFSPSPLLAPPCFLHFSPSKIAANTPASSLFSNYIDETRLHGYMELLYLGFVVSMLMSIAGNLHFYLFSSLTLFFGVDRLLHVCLKDRSSLVFVLKEQLQASPISLPTHGCLKVRGRNSLI